MKKKILSVSILTACWFGFAACEGKANAASSTEALTEEVTIAESAAISDDDDTPLVIEASGIVQELTPAQYDKMVAHYDSNPHRYIGYRPCIVDFYATWCGPCKKLAPIMERLAKKYKGQVSFYKVDVDKAEALSGIYGIQSIPTVFFCANGEIRSQVGLMPEETIEEIIAEMLTAPLK